MRWIVFSSLTCILAGATQVRADATDGRVLVISIDGLRPDVALRADMPNLRGLLDRGAYTFWARTTDVAITLPSHTSMLTGVAPLRHKIDWNDDVGEDRFRYPAFPTLFDVAKQAHYTTAMVAAKSKFVALAKPGTLDWQDLPETGKNYKAADLARRAAAVITVHTPQVMMIHLGDVDRVGHAIGWGTPEQLVAVHETDTALGVILHALRNTGNFDKTLIIVSSDHGGFARTHGANDNRALHIPWIAVGPGVRHNFDLTRVKSLTVHTEDTFATACRFLNLRPAADIDGHPVDAAFESQAELMTNDPTAALGSGK